MTVTLLCFFLFLLQLYIMIVKDKILTNVHKHNQEKKVVDQS